MSKKICFVGLDAYPVLNPLMQNEYFGGESVQQTLLAKAFVELGYDVGLISLDYGQDEQEIIDGITVYKTYKDGDGLPVLRFLYPKLVSIIGALKKANADIYFQSCAGMLTGVVAWFCKKYNRKFIFRLAHDTDCIVGKQIIPTWRDKKLYEFGLRNSNLISAQGVNQVKLLRENYKIDSTAINMAVQLPKDLIQVDKDIDILWVNNIRQFKRPELVFSLARLLPQHQFTMIGGAVSGNEDLYKEIVEMGDEFNNVSVLGAVSYHQVNRYFERSKIFLNTSDSEGFPNSFLQAWIRGLPVVSFFDPDGLIKKMHLGVVPKNISEMASILFQLLKNTSLLNEFGNNAKIYAKENYSPTVVAKQYQKILPDFV